MLVEGSGAVLADAVTGADRNLDRRLFTGAGVRLLGRATRAHRERGPSMGAMLDAANTPPRPEEKVLDRLRQLWDVTVPPHGASVFESCSKQSPPCRRVAPTMSRIC